MMPGLIEVIEGGIGNSLQDAGRFGYRHMGITVSGCLDSMLARCANTLVGNAPESDCACIEIRALGPTLQVRRGRVRLALAGEVSATLQLADGSTQDVPAWTSVTLDPQEILAVGSLQGGTAYLAVAGGFDTPVQLGSRSTYQRALIGGIDGRPLATGNFLPCSSQEHRDYRERQSGPWHHDFHDPDFVEKPAADSVGGSCADSFADSATKSIRVMLGPQDGHFKPESVSEFLHSEYQVTPQMDRMGMRLEGAPLIHVSPEAADIVSDGVTPGVIQVPGNGQPIILLADCQTVGGYPKIATVISADLPRLAQLKPGQTLRFKAVDAAQARQALRDREEKWKIWEAGISEHFMEASALYNDLSSIWIDAEW